MSPEAPASTRSPGSADAPLPSLTLSIEGTRIIARTAGGSVLSDAELIGTILTGGAGGDIGEAYRIDAVLRDPRDPLGRIYAYELSYYDVQLNRWEPACDPDVDGRRLGYALSGTWDERGHHRRDGGYSLTCTSGAIGKCVRLGYHPWLPASDGHDMWDLHQACTRVIRADYCGDGWSHTRDGTYIDLYDTAGVQRSTDPLLAFEAAWDADGAVCVSRTRVPDVSGLDQVFATCPDKLAGRVGAWALCTEELLPVAAPATAAVIFNRS